MSVKTGINAVFWANLARFSVKLTLCYVENDCFDFGAD